MTGLYAKTKVSVQTFFIAASLLALTGCVSDGGMSMPWGAQNTGVVTSDQNAMPNVSWQTNGNRRNLSQQNKEFAQQAAAAPAEKVHVALLLPLTGRSADLGQAMLKAAQMALFDVGSANFELVPRDTKSTPDGAAAAAQAAAAGHDDLILGPVFADDVKAAKPVASSANIPMIAFTTDWTLGGNNTYIMGFMPFAQVARVAQYAQAKGFGNIGVLAPTTEYCDVAIASLQRTGVDVVKVGRYSPQQPDLSQIIADFAETSKNGDAGYKFNALMLPVGGEGLRSLTSIMDLNKLDNQSVKFLGTGLWDDQSLTSNPALFGGWFAAPDPKLRHDFDARYQQNFGAVPPRLASLAYDATALSAVLARTTGGHDTYSRSTLTNPRGFAGIDGIFRFRSDGLSERGLAVLEIQSGRDVVVDPAPTAFISGS